MRRKSGTSGSEGAAGYLLEKDQVNWHLVGGLPYRTPGSASIILPRRIPGEPGDAPPGHLAGEAGHGYWPEPVDEAVKEQQEQHHHPTTAGPGLPTPRRVCLVAAGPGTTGRRAALRRDGPPPGTRLCGHRSAHSPAALAYSAPPDPGQPEAVSTPAVHSVVTGGMPGWQITLIAAGAALLTAVLAVPLDRARAARRHITAPGT